MAQPVRVDLSGSTIPTGEPAFDLRLGIDCGYLYYGEGGIVDTATTPALTGLEGAINGQVHDALRLVIELTRLPVGKVTR